MHFIPAKAGIPANLLRFSPTLSFQTGDTGMRRRESLSADSEIPAYAGMVALAAWLSIVTPNPKKLSFSVTLKSGNFVLTINAIG